MTENNSIYVSSDMLISEIIRRYPIAVYALAACGMGCVSCPSAAAETLREASLVHGLDADEVCAFLNDWLNDKAQEGVSV